MNTTELLQFHDDICKDAICLMKLKNHDYAGADGATPFANFEVGEKLGIGATEQGILFRLTDKVKRLVGFVINGDLKVKDESARDTTIDLINYAVILLAWMNDKAAKSNGKE